MMPTFEELLFGIVVWLVHQAYQVYRAVTRVYWAVKGFLKRRRRAILMNRIIAGTYLYNRPFKKLFWRTLAQSRLRRALSNCESHLDRIRTLNAHFLSNQFQGMLSTISDQLNKSDERARLMIDKARSFTRKSDFDNGLRSYNLAMCFAKSNSQQIGRIHIERFLLLVRMDQSPLHLVNIEMINPVTHSVANFGSSPYFRRFLSSDSESNLENEDKVQEFSNKIIFNIHGEKNDRIPSAADYVKMVWNKEKGRHLIVTKPLCPGTTVIIEEPYVGVLNDSPLWDTKHCAKCFRMILWGIPCTGCVFTLYCSEKCRLDDYNDGHQYECPCMPYIHAAKIPPNLHLALKAICKAGPSTLHNLYKERNHRRRSRRLIKGFDRKTGRYNSDSYYQVLYLASHTEGENICSLTWISIAITRILMSETTFFGDAKLKMVELPEFADFVTQAFFQHSISFHYNSFSLSENDHCEIMTTNSEIHDIERRLDIIEQSQIVSAVYSLLPIMNHSCYPTATRENLSNGKMAIITNRSLNPGDELSIGYGYDFMTYPLIERQTRLMNLYRFPCDCIPCKYKWPLLKDLRTLGKYLCPFCSVKFRHFQINELQKCTLNPEQEEDGVLICNKCENKFGSRQLLEETEYVEIMLVTADQLVMEGRPLSAIPILAACVDYFQRKIESPSPQLFLAQQLLQRAFEIVVHRK